MGENIFLEAMNLYSQLFESGFVKRTHMKFAVLSTCVIIACRLNKFPISFEDIYEITTENPNKIRKAYSNIINELKIQIPPLELKDYILYYSNLFDLGPKEKMKALEIAIKISKKLNLSGKKLSGYCAAIIKFVTKKTYLELEKKINAVSPTIRARLKEIKKVL